MSYEVVIGAVHDREHAELLRKELIRKGGYHDDVVSVREVGGE